MWWVKLSSDWGLLATFHHISSNGHHPPPPPASPHQYHATLANLNCKEYLVLRSYILIFVILPRELVLISVSVIVEALLCVFNTLNLYLMVSNELSCFHTNRLINEWYSLVCIIQYLTASTANGHQYIYYSLSLLICPTGLCCPVYPTYLHIKHSG